MVQNRVHIGPATTSAAHQATLVARPLDFGATLADVGQGNVRWTVLSDSEGKCQRVRQERQHSRLSILGLSYPCLGQFSVRLRPATRAGPVMAIRNWRPVMAGSRYRSRTTPGITTERARARRLYQQAGRR